MKIGGGLVVVGVRGFLDALFILLKWRPISLVNGF